LVQAFRIKNKSFSDGIVNYVLIEIGEEIDHVAPLTMEETSCKLAVMVSNEIEQSRYDADTLTTVVTASTAPVTFLASVMTGGDVSVEEDRNN
jgi:hypothetical protein